METPLTLNNARVVRELLIFCFSQNFTLGCYIVEADMSIASNDAPYKVSGNAKLLKVNYKKKLSARTGTFTQNRSQLFNN